MIPGPETLVERERQQRTLADISRVFLEYRGTDEVEPLRQIVELVANVFQAWCAFRLIQPGGLLVEVASYHPEERQRELARQRNAIRPPRPWTEELSARDLLRTGQPLLLEDIPEEVLRTSVPDNAEFELLRAMHLTSLVAAPIRLGSEPLGTLALSSTRSSPRRFTHEDLPFAIAVCDRAALAIRNARLARSLEEERQQLAQATAEAEHRAAQITTFISASPNGLAFFDENNRLQLLSPAMSRLFPTLPTPGQPTKEALTVLMGQAKNAETLTALCGDVLADLETTREISLELKPPTVRSIRCRTTPVRASDGAYQGRICVFEDVTRDRELDRMRMEFLSVAAHELRTPLTPLTMHLQTFEHRLARGQPLDPAMVTRSRRQVLRLSRLIDDLLDTTRLETGQLEMVRAPLRLDDLVRDIVLDFRSTHTRHDIVLDETSEQLEVEGDAGRLEQVLINLLQNAAKYSPEGGVISVRVRATPTVAMVAVVDSGIGIPESDQSQVFERFFRARNVSTREFSGLGIGLYISHEIVRRHKGRIEVQSAPNVGSTFTVHLPRLGHTGSRHRPRVLVAEDDEAVVEALRSFLSEEGYEVESVPDGAEALTALAREVPAVIILDLLMPVLDGWAFLDRLERDHLAPGVPVIVVSSDSGALPRSASGRVSAALRKPFGLDELKHAIERAHLLIPA